MRTDLASSLVLLAISVFVTAEAYGLRLGSLRRPGPGFFPFWTGLLLGLLSLALLLRALRRRELIRVTVIAWPTLLVVIAALLSYLLLLERLGFLVVTFLLLVLLFRLGHKGWASSWLWSLAATLASYALFQLWLRTQLPAGPFGF